MLLEYVFLFNVSLKAYEAEQFQAQKWPFLAAADRAVAPEMKKSSEEGAVAPIVMPVSVPIMAASQQEVGGGLYFINFKLQR